MSTVNTKRFMASWGVCIPSHPPYQRTVWDYAKFVTKKIKNEVNSTNWRARFARLGSDEMTNLFTSKFYSILSMNIPNKTLKCNDKDAPWISPDVTTAIKRKHRVFKEFVDGGRKEEDWKHVKEVRIETSKMIHLAKEAYYLKLGHKLVDPKIGIKAC